MELNRDTMKRLMLLIFYTIALLAAALQLERILQVAGWLFGLFVPFLLGAAIAFILNVPMRAIERVLPEGKKQQGRRPLALILALCLVLLVLGIVFFLVVPQITSTLISVADLLPRFFLNLQKLLEQKFSEYPEVAAYIGRMNVDIDWKDTLEKAAGGAGTVLSSTFMAARSIASGLTSFGIAFVFALYLLLQKERLARQFKKLFYAYLPESLVNTWIQVARRAEETFSRFLAGQCVEAVILGTMFFVVLSLCRLPYALLIGVLIAFTALIPVFGAFIGCAIGLFLTIKVRTAI